MIQNFLHKQFGFTFKTDKKRIHKKISSPVVPDIGDGSSLVAGGHLNSAFFQASEGTNIDENEMIKKYREVAAIAEAEDAIDDIVNEAVVIEDNKSVVVNVDKVTVIGDETKEQIQKEFEKVLNLLDWNNQGQDIFRKWYIDGRIYYNKVIEKDEDDNTDSENVDENKTAKGIIELRFMDPVHTKKVIEFEVEDENGVKIFNIQDEYFVYNPYQEVKAQNGFEAYSTDGIRISNDSVSYAHSGLFTSDRKVVLSHMHKAIKPFNQMRMVEDGSVIYRLTRAQEKRAFYIDVGNLPPQKAESYVSGLMNKFKTQIAYDPSTGDITDQNYTMGLNEDFWLPRQEGGKGTEIQTLQSGANLGEMTDVEYFKKKFLLALKVPISRQEQGAGFSLGRSSEITRDELKFGKFIRSLRTKFSVLFDDLLYTQLVLKKIITDSEWQKIKEDIYYDWNDDSYFTEFKDNEIIRERLALLTDAEPYIGTYYSENYVKKHFLKLTEQEQKEVKNDNDKEAVGDEEPNNADDSFDALASDDVIPTASEVEDGEDEDLEGLLKDLEGDKEDE